MMEFPSSGDFPSVVAARKDEVFVTAMCKNARVENTALGKRRKDLRRKLTILRDKLQQNDDDYWRQYHLRLDATGKATGKATSVDQWIGDFATKESAAAKQTKARMDELRRQIKGLEAQLQEADDDFWGKWQDNLARLASIPRPSSAPFSALSPVSPESSSPSKPTQPSVTDHTTKMSLNNNDTMAPPPRPRRTSMLAAPARSNAKLRPRIAVNTQKDLRCGQAGFHRIDNPAVPHGQMAHSPVLSFKASQTSQSKPPCAATSPLAPPVLFPHGPVPAKFIADHGRSQLPVETASSPSTASSSGISLPAIDSCAPSHTRNATAPQDETAPFHGVTSPKAGQLYKAYYKHDDHEGWWMCTVLPTLPAHESEAWAREVGMSFTTANLDLWADAPKCYNLTIQAKRKAGKLSKRHHVITGWHQGYGDGQPLMNERVFPVLFFEDRKGVHGHFDVPMPPKKFNFKPGAWDWVEAKNLRPVDVDVGPVHGEILADKFMKRLEALRQKDDASRASSPTDTFGQASPAAKRRRVKSGLSSSQSAPARRRMTEYDTKQDDTEMADAGSLSGDTIAESSVGHSDDETCKPSRLIFSFPFGLEGTKLGNDRVFDDRNDS